MGFGQDLFKDDIVSPRLKQRQSSNPAIQNMVGKISGGKPRATRHGMNRTETGEELEALRVSVQRGRPFGKEGWVNRMVKRFGMESTLRPRGRPKGS